MEKTKNEKQFELFGSLHISLTQKWMISFKKTQKVRMPKENLNVPLKFNYGAEIPKFFKTYPGEFLLSSLVDKVIDIIDTWRVISTLHKILKFSIAHTQRKTNTKVCCIYNTSLTYTQQAFIVDRKL